MTKQGDLLNKETPNRVNNNHIQSKQGLFVPVHLTAIWGELYITNRVPDWPILAWRTLKGVVIINNVKFAHYLIGISDKDNENSFLLNFAKYRPYLSITNSEWSRQYNLLMLLIT